MPIATTCLNMLLWAPLIAAVLIVGSAWRRLKRGSDTSQPIALGDEMGLPTWDFTKSWASNLTAAGALLGSVLTLVLPEQSPLIAKQTYLVLNGLFLAMIGAAPYFYNAGLRAVPEKPPKATPVVYHGFVVMFLIACIMTTWGVYGQMASLFVMLMDIGKHNLWTAPVITLFQVILVFIMLALLPYLYKTIYWTVINQKVQEQAAVVQGGKPLQILEGQPASQPSRSWSLL